MSAPDEATYRLRLADGYAQLFDEPRARQSLALAQEALALAHEIVQQMTQP